MTNKSISEITEDFIKAHEVFQTPTFIKKVPKGRVLDVGFGQGGSLRFFQSRKIECPEENISFDLVPRRWIGVDSGANADLREIFMTHEKSSDQPFEYHNKDFMTMSPKEIKGPISLIILSKVIHFLSYEEAQEWINHAASFIEKGGWIYIKVYSKEHRSCNDWMKKSKVGIGQNCIEVEKPVGSGHTFKVLERKAFKYEFMRFYGKGDLTELLRVAGFLDITEKSMTVKEEDEHRNLHDAQFIYAIARKS